MFSASAAVMTAALAVQPATALEYNFGGVQVFLDTTVSAGVSVRVADRNALFLPESNGGGSESNADVLTIPGLPTLGGLAGQVVTLDTNTAGDNFDGSINTDDGRLNFDKGDLTSGVVKMTNDIQANYENYKFFARVSSFYDAVLDNSSSFERSAIGDGAKTDTARDIDLLDFYVSGDFNVGDLPLNVRLGKQVISWGEGTFFLNGINAINPIDVSAFRRPGVEIKEGLLPVWAVYGSLGLPYDLSLEAFYQLEWEEFQLDRPGTPFSGSDVLFQSSQRGGNQNATSFITGGNPTTGSFRDCGGLAGNPIAAAIDAALVAAPGTFFDNETCSGTNPFANFTTNLPIGQAEANLLDPNIVNHTGVIRRLQDREASDSGQYGVAMRWYSEDLNSTEFGFYFMNYHSRLPIASQRVRDGAAAGGSVLNSFLAAGQNGDVAGRGISFGGCNLTAANANPLTAANQGVLLTADQTFGLPLGVLANPAKLAVLANPANTSDPAGLIAAVGPTATAFFAGLGPVAAGSNPLSGALAAAGLGASPFAGGVAGANIGPMVAAITSIGQSAAAGLAPGATVAAAAAAAGAAAPIIVAPGSGLEAAITNCGLVGAQSATIPAPGTPLGTANVLVDGAQVIGTRAASGIPPIGLFLEYPEDIKLYGVSFNTTIGDWGVQGEVAFRQNQPLQLDTDQLTIASLLNTCFFDITFGANTGAIFDGGNTFNSAGTSCGNGFGTGGTELNGFVREEVLTASLGTTATYTNSNPAVGALGADLGILITEVGVMHVPDVPGEDAPSSVARLGNVCTAGTDLPLAGFLGLDQRSGCRATEFSYGYLLLGQLQYNNAFGTPITLNPTMVWQHDVKGNSPAPLSNYREGRKRVSLALNGSYQNTWRGGISYTNFFGNEKYSKDGDRDFVSVNLSYSF